LLRVFGSGESFWRFKFDFFGHKNWV
jgi:hypothetical protein